MNLTAWLTLAITMPLLISLVLGLPSVSLAMKGIHMIYPHSEKATSKRATGLIKLQGRTYLASGICGLVIMSIAISCFFVLVLLQNIPSELIQS